MNRRELLTLSLAPCERDLKSLHLETNESPFFEHYHQLILPVAALLNPTKNLVLQTSAVDQGSMDEEGFEQFIASSRLNAEKLRVHTHAVTLTIEQLKRIASGESDVEVRVISPAGNYVHNLLITAYQSSLAQLKMQSRKRKK